MSVTSVPYTKVVSKPGRRAATGHILNKWALRLCGPNMFVSCHTASPDRFSLHWLWLSKAAALDQAHRPRSIPVMEALRVSWNKKLTWCQKHIDGAKASRGNKQSEDGNRNQENNGFQKQKTPVKIWSIIEPHSTSIYFKSCWVPVSIIPPILLPKKGKTWNKSGLQWFQWNASGPKERISTRNCPCSMINCDQLLAAMWLSVIPCLSYCVVSCRRSRPETWRLQVANPGNVVGAFSWPQEPIELKATATSSTWRQALAIPIWHGRFLYRILQDLRLSEVETPPLCTNCDELLGFRASWWLCSEEDLFGWLAQPLPRQSSCTSH